MIKSSRIMNKKDNNTSINSKKYLVKPRTLQHLNKFLTQKISLIIWSYRLKSKKILIIEIIIFIFLLLFSPKSML